MEEPLKEGDLVTPLSDPDWVCVVAEVHPTHGWIRVEPQVSITPLDLAFLIGRASRLLAEAGLASTLGESTRALEQGRAALAELDPLRGIVRLRPPRSAWLDPRVWKRKL